MEQVRIEKCGWTYQDWAGVFYPMETAPGDFLTYCAEHYPIMPRVENVMDAEAGFIEAIRQRSDDRERWLIFADWLEEQGDPRGELIRLQVHLAELSGDDPGRLALQDREFVLFHTIPRETMALYPPRVAQILIKAAMPIEEASSILVGGMATDVEAFARALRQLGGFPDEDDFDLSVSMPGYASEAVRQLTERLGRKKK
jgi:uncharacterized protein (TIGR02996 family)